ncbi:MAG: 2-oxo-4-hydroxy-4-carboxy-5-ureidoimidazoline decarboxylase [Acidimicrobiia bacterium]|nr:2-oxo-4-hydroxy-4-carboxy-5-ureidoimidazoline decarboxylase [Acidimicrobiia bacterium]
MTLAKLNRLDRDAFVEAVGRVFEHSPWVAARAWGKRPFATLDALHAAMTAELRAASEDERLALIRAHPDLGTRARMSASSTSEQAGAGLDALAPAEFERLLRLNAAYRGKFGFPFLYAVRGRSKHDILNALETRLSAARDEELAEALRQIDRIARVRLEQTIQEQP